MESVGLFQFESAFPQERMRLLLFESYTLKYSPHSKQKIIIDVNTHN